MTFDRAKFPKFTKRNFLVIIGAIELLRHNVLEEIDNYAEGRDIFAFEIYLNFAIHKIY